MRVGIERADEADPVALHEGHDARVGALAAVRLRAAYAPDGGDFGDVGHPKAGAHGARVLDVIAVVEVAGDVAPGVLRVEVHPRANVAQLAVCGAGRVPVFVGSAGSFGGWVEGDEFVELGGGDGGELGLDPVF